LENYSVQLVQFVVQIILTRILLPTDFATMALLMVAVSFGAVLIEGGLSSALVQRGAVGEIERSTAFFLSLAVAALLYFLVFLGSPFISSFYGVPELASALRVTALVFVVGSFNSVQVAEALRQFQFRALMTARLVSQVAAGTLAVIAAINGSGIWSLVILNVAGTGLYSLVLATSVRWWPRFAWSFKSARELFGYGWKTLAGGLAYTSYIGVYSLAIGRMPDGQLLGFFDRGRQIPSFLVNTFNGAVSAVSFPYLSRLQHDVARIRHAMGRTLRLSAAVSMPAALGLYAVAAPLVEVVLGAKWLSAVFFLQMWALYFLFSPLANVNQQALKAVGRVGTYLRCEVLEVSFGLVLVAVLWRYGIHAVMLGLVASAAAGAVIHATPSGRVFGFGLRQQLASLRDVIVGSVIMFACVLLLGGIPVGPMALLGIQAAGGVLVYVAALKFLGAAELEELVEIVHSILRPGKK
jgi:teichuronic acid exporter